MRSMVLAAVAVVVFGGAAFADGARLTGLPAALLRGEAAEGTQHMLPEPPVSSIKAGKLSVALGQTSLSDVAAAFGGTVQKATDGGVSASWLCYTFAPGGQAGHLWFVANGDTPGLAVNLVGGNLVTEEQTPQPCVAPSSDLSGTDFSVPSLGASEADLQSRFGTVDARAGFVAYSSQQGTALQNLNYLIRDGVVTGVAVTRITSP